MSIPWWLSQSFGSSPRVRAWTGRVAGVTGLGDIWGGPTAAIPLLADDVAAPMEVVSSSGDDTATTGTGARTVGLRYVTTEFVEKTVTLDLAGATPVAGPTDFHRAQDFWVASAGSGGAAAGNIDLRTVTGSTVHSRIVVGFNVAQTALYTVPKGFVGFLEGALSAAPQATDTTAAVLIRASQDPTGTRLDGPILSVTDSGILGAHGGGVLALEGKSSLAYREGVVILGSVAPVDGVAAIEAGASLRLALVRQPAAS